jgi:mitosis inhibitor protein kinase SWE1
MNLDQASLGSPAKRRSLHGASFDAEFNILDQEELGASMNPDIDMSDARTFAPSKSSHHLTQIPRRTTSLRKSTRQQRQHEKPSFARSRPNPDLAFEFATPGVAASKSRARLSLENQLPPLPRDSPFSSQGLLPSASVHVVQQHSQVHQPHPLSRTIPQSSSSTSSISDEASTRLPSDPSNAGLTKLDFSKSLPPDYFRSPGTQTRSIPETKSSAEAFATPQNFRMLKPPPGAFMSTGLISKRNRTLEDLRVGPAASRGLMPETPCKRPSSVFPTVAPPFRSGAVPKPKQSRPEFGTPSTPFQPYPLGSGARTFGKGVGVFGGSISRRSSFLSIDGEETAKSPDRSGRQGDSQSSELEMPPTPTKNGPLDVGISSDGFSKSIRKSIGQYSGAPAPTSAFGRAEFDRQSSKSFQFGSLWGSADDGSDCGADESPTAVRTAAALRNVHSFSAPESRALDPRRVKHSKFHTLQSMSKTGSRSHTKQTALTASPLRKLDFSQRPSPHTPQETILPPDPSGLSISGKHPDAGDMDSSSSTSSIPATPTGGREYFDFLAKRRASITPIHNPIMADLDRSLKSRFDNVELIGTGEFSEVYRVTKAVEAPTSSPYLLKRSQSSITESSYSSTSEKTYAVKKARKPYLGPRDRARRLEEVNILRKLVEADHVVQLVDSWEERSYLYIQTEFCEEGSLDLFLAQIGINGRLDDFRTWKILLESGQGLQHIHDQGFIHLDLKPANILITFEGVLKIADFGMATRWPASPGIEGEGDREYIGPEILIGQYDKPADIFALGLIMLEIAANVQLPDNGASWQKLRAGDMSEVPSLTWNSESSIFRDASANPISDIDAVEIIDVSDSLRDDVSVSSFIRRPRESGGKPLELPSELTRHGELINAPAFMMDPNHAQSLDRLVEWMISPSPADRPTAGQVLDTIGIKWVDERKRAGATIFEGSWGPADEVLADDAEMMDV